MVEVSDEEYVGLPTLQGARLHFAAKLQLYSIDADGLFVYEVVDEPVHSLILHIGRPGSDRERERDAEQGAL